MRAPTQANDARPQSEKAVMHAQARRKGFSVRRPRLSSLEQNPSDDPSFDRHVLVSMAMVQISSSVFCLERGLFIYAVKEEAGFTFTIPGCSLDGQASINSANNVH